MDDLTDKIVERETALANFDHARDDFERAFAQIPDEALDWMPEGDDYSFGTILAHVARSIEGYLNLLDLMEQAEYQEVRLVAAPGEYSAGETPPTSNRGEMDLSIRRGAAVKGNRQAALEALESVHDRLAARLRALAYSEYSKPADVYYLESTEPYPTRASDLLGWLTDHYYEHVEQYGKMLEEWKNRAAANS